MNTIIESLHCGMMQPRTFYDVVGCKREACQDDADQSSRASELTPSGQGDKIRRHPRRQ